MISAWKLLDRFQTRLVNPIVGWLLRTPLHDLLSRRVMLLTVTGRRSGAAIRLPVQYERQGDTLTVTSRPSRLWWRNLEGGAPVRITLDGVPREGHAEVGRAPAGPVTGGSGTSTAMLATVVVTVRLTTAAPAPAGAPAQVGWRWMRTVTLGEIVGFSLPALVGALVAGPAWSALGIEPFLRAAAVVMAGTVEGAVLGLAQAYVLRTALPAIATRDWVRATMGGAAIAWGVGALPVLDDRVLGWPPAVLSLLGLTLLAAMGLLQWRVLSRHVRAAFWWVVATAGSWLVALGVFMLVTTPLWQEGQPAWLIVAIGVLGGAAMAVTVAALTAVAFVRLLARSISPQERRSGVH
ncbi:nitroreductase/quinone reductase family protein [Nonomuraea sp. NPDC001684]